MTNSRGDRTFGHWQVPPARQHEQGRDTVACAVSRIGRWVGVAATSLLLTGCGLSSGLACFGTPSPLRLTLEPEVLELSPGASGSVLATVEGLREGCFPSATAAGVHEVDRPEGFTAEPVMLTAHANAGVFVVTAAPSVEPGTYVFPVRAFAYHSNRVVLSVTVVAP